MATRTTVNLPDHEYDALKALADRRDISFTHALRQAIQSELYIQSLVDNNSRLLAQTSDGELKELVFTQATAPVTSAGVEQPA
jgi:predicted transcriptional regulator